MTRRTLVDGSIGAARRRLALEFRRGGLDAPELDARIIVGHALGLDHTALATHSSRMLAADEAGAIAALSARRLAREPVARLLGRKEFWGLPLKVNAETLLPRPETETVVEAKRMADDDARIKLGRVETAATKLERQLSSRRADRAADERPPRHNGAPSAASNSA